MYKRTIPFSMIEGLVLLLFAISPFITVINGVAFRAGWVKDFICILICLFALFNRIIAIKQSYSGILIYFGLVCISLVLTGAVSISAKFDLFRYRVEYMITFFLLFNCYRLSVDEIQKLGRDVLKVVYFTSVVVALIGLVEFINPSIVHSIYGSRLTAHTSLILGGGKTNRLLSTMGNPINLGLQMGIGIVTALYLFYQKDSKRTKSRIALLASIFAFLFVAFFTYSRTAYVSIISIIAFYFSINFLLGKKKLKKIIPIILLACIIAIAGYYIASRNSSIMYRLGSISFSTYTDNTRYGRVSNAFKEIANNPFKLILGFGVGTILGGSSQYVFELGFASLLYESGIVALIIFLLYIIRSFLFAITSTRNGSDFSVLASILASFNLGFFVAMFAGDVYAQYPYNLFFWFSIILGEEIRMKLSPIHTNRVI